MNLDPQSASPDTLNPAPSPLAALPSPDFLKLGAPPNGKIAKLPAELRTLLNQMLSQGATGAVLITGFGRLGASPGAHICNPTRNPRAVCHLHLRPSAIENQISVPSASISGSLPSCEPPIENQKSKIENAPQSAAIRRNPPLDFFLLSPGDRSLFPSPLAGTRLSTFDPRPSTPPVGAFVATFVAAPAPSGRPAFFLRVSSTPLASSGVAGLRSAGSRDLDHFHLLDNPSRTVIAEHGVVAAAHPLAAAAGLEMLKKGGNAADAAIATSVALGVVEPNASGLSGGGFALLYLAREKKSYVIDFRETAPGKARPDTYVVTANSKAANNASTTGYQAVAVPGQLRGLELLHKQFSTKKWADLFKPAIQQAEAGLKVSETLSQIVTAQMERLKKAPAMAWMQQNFYKDGLPVQPGDVVRNPELAQTLRKIALGGAEVFYTGEIGREIVKDFARRGGGWITASDLAGYEAVLREPIQGTYRGYTIITLPPPSSGGVALIELLNILEGYDLARLGQGSADYLHVCIEAQKLAFAERVYMADPAFANVPVAGLCDKKYAAERRNLIHMQKARKAGQGRPSKVGSGNTTSFSVVDKEGNVVTITQTLNHFLGAGVVPEGTGILLNDEMDDFDFDPGSVNSPAPGKRPLSSMAPFIMFKDGKPFMTAGSPGATRIVTALANIILGVVDFSQGLQAAILAPRFHNGNLSETAVESRIALDVLKVLKLRGHKFSVRKELDFYFGGAQGILFGPDGKLVGAGDPRRDGVAVGY